jgi:oligoendopeptidase F
MTHKAVRPRAEIPDRYKWDASSIFKTSAEMQALFKETSRKLEQISAYQGRLGESPAVLLEALRALEQVIQQAGWIAAYTYVDYHVDTGDQAAARRYGEATALNGQLHAGIAFFGPELLDVGQEILERWMHAEPDLEVYRQHIEDIFRKQTHIRSGEVEELLGMLRDPFQGAETTFSMLVNSDMRFPPARSSDGVDLPVTDGTLGTRLSDPDREVRRTAWEGYYDTYLSFKNTLASNLTTSMKQDWVKARSRRHGSALEAALFEHNIPVEVFHNLIDTFRENLPTWHRYWAVRRKILGVDELRPYDIWAPLTPEQPQVPYEQAVEWIVDGLKPMGEEYVSVLRKGCLEQRWVDVYPNIGKVSGAFSAGRKGTHPFIVMNYNDSLFSLSTLAHELGHSMHSYYAWQNQPVLYSEYSLFVAEVASNFHQAMVRAYLLENVSEPAFQISLIEEAMSNFHRYFFIMPTLARFELETHSRVERGEGLSADQMIEILAGFFEQGYGKEMVFDRERVGVTWATFVHLFEQYYVFQYATGISGAHALAGRILAGEAGAVEDYLGFLKSGASGYPLDVLKQAGVDLTTPAPVQDTFRTLSALVDRLEELTAN